MDSKSIGITILTFAARPITDLFVALVYLRAPRISVGSHFYGVRTGWKNGSFLNHGFPNDVTARVSDIAISFAIPVPPAGMKSMVPSKRFQAEGR
jgi:hypothetical protein